MLLNLSQNGQIALPVAELEKRGPGADAWGAQGIHAAGRM